MENVSYNASLRNIYLHPEVRTFSSSISADYHTLTYLVDYAIYNGVDHVGNIVENGPKLEAVRGDRTEESISVQATLNEAAVWEDVQG